MVTRFIHMTKHNETQKRLMALSVVRSVLNTLFDSLRGSSMTDVLSDKLDKHSDSAMRSPNLLFPVKDHLEH